MLDRRAVVGGLIAVPILCGAAGPEQRRKNMRYVSFRKPDGQASFGHIVGDTVIDLRPADGSLPDLKAAIAADALGALVEGDRHALGDVTLLPVIPNPDKIFCVGLNYATHVAETGREQKEFPAIFTRWADTLIADGAPMVRPPESVRFDYEGELAIVIGKGGRRISKEDAASHIAGYSIFNDGSLRDWQRHNIQFTPGKNFPGTGGFGPALVTPEEIEDLGSQRVQTRLNGELVQDQPISDMIWDIATVIEYCSGFTTLMPGDVIATGTPGGVGDKRTPPLYMKAGDVVEVSIEVIGTLRNDVVDE
jgi:2-keto-4-pentenoate hydratase/2-oxohepta-3-ene-1,7-dioic acid hydratase in catechol pathway